MAGRLIISLVVATIVGCASQPPAPVETTIDSRVDSARVLEDLRFLSGPALAGRATGTAGNETARRYIESALTQAGARPFNGQWGEPFALSASNGARTGRNVVGVIEGSQRKGRYIVVSAHFDHLGTRDGAVYYGADDNASGSAALLELARYFGSNPPRNSIIFAAFDAEELGLQGARAFVENPPVPVDSISLNVNMDMVGRNAQGELFVAGTYAYPFLSPLVDEVAAASAIKIRKGHDRPDGSAGDDWTPQSDHGAFHAAGVPFLYFGVEDHPDYHRPSDTFERIQPGFYLNAVRSVLHAVQLADERL